MYNKLGSVAFPALTYIPVKTNVTNLNTVLAVAEYSLDNLVVVYKDTMYYVGNKAAKKDADGGEQNLQQTRYKEDKAIVQLLAGLSYMFPEATEIEVEYLMAGLSLESFYKYGEDLEAFYRAKEFPFQVPGKMVQ